MRKDFSQCADKMGNCNEMAKGSSKMTIAAKPKPNGAKKAASNEPSSKPNAAPMAAAPSAAAPKAAAPVAAVPKAAKKVAKPDAPTAPGQILPISRDKLVPFAIDSIIDNSKTDFDLFLHLNRHTVLYGNIGYYWVKSELEELLRGGYTHFLVKPEDQAKIQMYTHMNRLPKIEEKLPPEHRMLQIEKVGEVFTRYMFEGEVTNSCVTEGKKVASTLTECVLEDPGCISALGGLARHDQYLYLHSVRVAAYSVAIAISLGLKDAYKLKQIAVGGLFHDIGKKDIPLDILNKAGTLTEEEWKIMRSHPSVGFDLAADTQLDAVAKDIIRHHHEKPDGSGYPDGLLAMHITPEVEIANLADIFDALTSSRSYQQKRSKFHALEFIKQKLVSKGLISKEVYMALIQSLTDK